MTFHQAPFLTGLLAGLFATLLFTWWSARRLTQRFQQELTTRAATVSQLQEELALAQEEQSKTATILERLREGVIAVDTARRVSLINAQAEAWFSAPPAHARGKPLVEVVKHAAIDRLVQEAMRQRSVVASEVELTHNSGRMVKVQAIGLPEQRGNVAAILVLYDVTKVRRLEQMRRDFVANVSHELKTPLTSIQGFIETLLAGAHKQADKSKQFLTLMAEDAKRLGHMIHDLLELSQLESKQVTLDRETVPLAPLVDKAAHVLSAQAKAQQVQISNHVQAGEAESVYADSGQLEHVLTNLLDNAIKFNQEGGQVTVSSERVGDAVKISVTDTGVGIPQEAIPRLFERFFRVDKARSRALGGTGLGLAIVKHIVEAHGGRVSCTSTPGQGSTFSFTIPTIPSVIPAPVG